MLSLQKLHGSIGIWWMEHDLFPLVDTFTFSGQQHLVVLTPQQPVSLSDQNKLSNCNKAIVSLNKVLRKINYYPFKAICKVAVSRDYF